MIFGYLVTTNINIKNYLKLLMGLVISYIFKTISQFFYKSIKDEKNENIIKIQVYYNLNKEKGFLKLNLSSELYVSEVKKLVVLELKKLLNSKNEFIFRNLNLEELVIIFVGQELPDDAKIFEYNLAQNTQINVVKISGKKNLSNQNSFIKKTFTDENIIKKNELETNENSFKKESFFFVYCNSENCKTIKSGKLRVKCSKCNNHTLVVKNGPKNWDDVSLDNIIKGDCRNEFCDGTFAKFYFKCSDESHINDNLTSECIPLKFFKKNINEEICLVCNENNFTIFVFDCKHIICFNCFKDYCRSNLLSRTFELVENIGYTLKCPMNCFNSYIDNILYYHILSNNEYEKYESFAVEDYIVKNNGFICPNSKCCQGFLLDNIDKTCNKVFCPTCNYLFCKKCKNDFHQGDCVTNVYLESLRTFKQNNSNLKNDTHNKCFSNTKLINLKTKPCPNCKVPTEKDSGCMSIICSRCKLNWCWICVKKWNYDCMSDHWFE